MASAKSLQRLCRETLPLMLQQANGQKMMAVVRDVVQTDRWNSFDRFGETTATLTSRYEAAGARVEVESIQTGGRIGSGRWIIREAADVVGATVDVVHPITKRVLDWQENPWHVIQWSAATPADGVRLRLVILDQVEDVQRQPTDGLAGAIVLTKLDPRSNLGLLAAKGATAVIADRPVPNLPNAVAWTKFGWGAIPLAHATARLVGFVISEQQGKRLRRLAQQRGPLTLHVRADIRKYVGSHDAVSGVIEGAGDPQDEVWAIAHSGEPGAIDNASGVATTLEIVRVIEGLIHAGKLARPKRTIRLLNAYECYGFFAYLERVRRLQTPLAGVCIDSVGSRPAVCEGRLEWHATIPMSAGFVDRVGEAVLRAGVRRHKPGYRVHLERFMATSDTLIGDPQYGFPCPWITTHHSKSGRGFDAYHSSADVEALLSRRGLETCAASMAAYLYYLADMGSREVGELVRTETQHFLSVLEKKKWPRAEAEYVREAHSRSVRRLTRWLWGGSRREILEAMDESERQVAAAATKAALPDKRARRTAQARLVPRRTAVLSPTGENTPAAINERISAAQLSPWALFWADGCRNLGEIAECIACEEADYPAGPRTEGSVSVDRVYEYFAAHAELGYAALTDPAKMIGRKELVKDLRRLGVTPGMDLMVHSSLSAIGFVEGGAETVVDALLQAVGKRGTLLAPSFNHRAAKVFNRLTSPTTNGAIPDALWRRTEAERSMHPTHAVAAIGPRASDYCHGHLEAGIWAPDSPIGKLVHGGGYILALGTTHDTSTAYHVAEMSVPCGCIESFAIPDRIVREDGTVDEVLGLAFRNGPCPVPTHKLDSTLDRRKLQRRGKVGQAECELVKAHVLWQVRREHLRRVCPTCTVKPQTAR
ncbi:MAG: AAC(3) family N-acetyltransferase [Gemmatimonadota bacterium]|nr:AAC(3) family N-acetyltransferase [Gemmatimonadota bacterium]